MSSAASQNSSVLLGAAPAARECVMGFSENVLKSYVCVCVCVCVCVHAHARRCPCFLPNSFLSPCGRETWMVFTAPTLEPAHRPCTPRQKTASVLDMPRETAGLMTTGRRQEDTGTVASDLLWINYIQTKCRVRSAVAIGEIQSSRENFQFGL